MKKLMIAAAVMGAAVAAQAATEWQFNLAYNEPIKAGYKATEIFGTSDDTIGAGYNVYIISSASDTEGYHISAGDFLTGLREGNSVEAVAGNAIIATTTTTADGLFESFSKEMDERYYLDLSEVMGSTDYDEVRAYLAVVVGNDVYLSDDASGKRMFHTIDLSSYGSDTRMDTADTMDSYYGSGWYAIAAPEPTSGLLMLLGFAGLALKRRKM